VVVKVQGIKPEEVAVEAVAVKGDAGNDHPKVFFTMVFHLYDGLFRRKK
jgi:uncharacterized Zn-finger protein